MPRFLFVVPPFAGHVYPTVPVAAELVRRGHEVAWTGMPGATEELLPPGSTYLPATSPELAEYAAERSARRPDLRGAAAYKFLQEEVLIPMAGAMADGVDAAVERWRPDVLVVDQQALAGALVARRRGLVWATSATTSAELVDPLTGLPKVSEAMHRTRVELQVAHGIPADVAERGDLRISPHLVLAYTSRGLVDLGEGSLHPAAAAAPIVFVGPSTLGRPETDDFDWELLDPSLPQVLVSLGTLNAGAGARFWQVAAEAFSGQPWQGVFVAPPELVPDPPANVLVRQRIPQLAVLKRMDAVVSHAGHNTVCESLAAGLPLVVAPIRDDQPVVADQVERAGAGLRVKFARVKAPELAAAVTRVLEDEALRATSREIADDLAAHGGPGAAADALTTLLARHAAGVVR